MAVGHLFDVFFAVSTHDGVSGKLGKEGTPA